MNGWFAVARISCSVRARLIFFRSIISFFERTAFLVQGVSVHRRPYNGAPFMAKSLLVFFSRTRYTFPTSPLPSILILWKLAGPTSTYARTRQGTLGGGTEELGLPT